MSTLQPQSPRTPLIGTLLLALGALMLGICFVPDLSFKLSTPVTLSVHIGFETASIAVALMVFSVGWFAVERGPSSIFSVAASAFAGVALLDFAHTLVYQGMPLFNPQYNLTRPAIAYFLAARLLAAVALLLVAVFPEHRSFSYTTRRNTLLGTLLLSMAVICYGSIWPQALPIMFVPETGLTATKVYTEYLIIALNLLTALVLWQRLRAAPRSPQIYPLAACVVMAMSEFFFTLYGSTTDQFIHTAHAYKVIAYLLIFWGLVVIKIRLPMHEIRAAQAEAAEQRARLSSIFASAMDGIISIDDEQRIVLFNEAAERMFERSAQEMLGHRLDELMPQRFQRVHEQHVERFAAATTQMRNFGMTRAAFGRRRDGSEFPIEASISKAVIAGREVHTVILRDVTERVKAEQAMRQLHSELEDRVARRTAELQSANADREVRLRELEALAGQLRHSNAELAYANSELDTYAFTVSHDLRAPLRSIDGFTALLQDELSAQTAQTGTQAQDLLGRIRARVKHMNGLLEDLLQLSRFSRQDIARVDLDMQALVQGIVEDLRPADSPVRFEIDTLPPCRADANLIHQVWANLIANAIKYSAKTAQPVVRVGFADGAYFVEDNGAGFDMTYADKLFKVFSRLHGDREFAGTGIGLAIVRRILQRHGGDIHARGAVGAGARFWFTVPGR